MCNVRYQIRLPKALATEFRGRCRSKNRTAADVIRSVLTEWCEAQRPKGLIEVMVPPITASDDGTITFNTKFIMAAVQDEVTN